MLELDEKHNGKMIKTLFLDKGTYWHKDETN